MKRNQDPFLHPRFKIIKASGKIEPFSKRKLFLSLERSGLPKRQCQSIANKVASEIGEGSSTQDIYKKASQIVKQSSPYASIQYSLKRAIFHLGPDGHHFETFVAAYFREQGFSVRTCFNVTGKFVNHEIDVEAIRGGQKTFIECKFHNRQGIKNDVKISLYVKARWDDVKEGPQGRDLTDFYVASNTAFTKDAITYAKGTGLKLLGPNAPASFSFLDEIKKMRLYPITSLSRMNRRTKLELLSRNIVIIKELVNKENLLYRLGLPEKEINTIMDEIHFILRMN